MRIKLIIAQVVPRRKKRVRESGVPRLVGLTLGQAELP